MKKLCELNLLSAAICLNVDGKCQILCKGIDIMQSKRAEKFATVKGK